MLFRSDRKSTRLNSSHTIISYAVFCLKKNNLLLQSADGSDAARDDAGSSCWRRGAPGAHRRRWPFQTGAPLAPDVLADLVFLRGASPPEKSTFPLPAAVLS